MKNHNLLLTALLASTTPLTAFSQVKSEIAPADTVIKSQPAISATIGRSVGLSVVLPTAILNCPCEMDVGVISNLPNKGIMNGDQTGYINAGLRTTPIRLPKSKITAYAGVNAYMGVNKNDLVGSAYLGVQNRRNLDGMAIRVFAELHQMVGRRGSGINFTGAGVQLGIRALLTRYKLKE